MASKHDIARSTHKFAFQIYNSLLKDGDPEKNIFYSPASIYAVLAMTYAGALGRTAKEMKKVMGLPIDDYFDDDQEENEFHETFGKVWNGIIKANCNDSVNLLIANRIWLQKGGEVESSFQKKLLEYYKADASPVDFCNDAESARKEINLWIEEKTNQKIKDTIKEDSLCAATKILMINALYFNAKWKHMFKEEKTTSMPFYTLDGKSYNVDMMYQKKQHGYIEHKPYGMQALSLRYENSTLTMVILLPDENDGILKLEKLLYDQSLKKNYIQDFQRDNTRKTLVYLPKFKISQKNSMAEILKGLGMNKLFSPAEADLTGISKDHLYVSGIAHEAYCEVNEAGTAAVAVTASEYRTAGGGSPPVFKADHPFLFYIVDNDTHIILFSGRMCRPSYDD